MDVFCTPLNAGDMEAKLLCPVCALSCNVEDMGPIRHTKQLFICFGGGMSGKALLKKCLATGFCESISQAGCGHPTVACAHMILEC